EEASAATSGSWSPDSSTSVGSREGTLTNDAEDVGRPWSPVGSPVVATAPMPTPAWERLEEEQWNETLVSNYVRNGRYSSTRPLWRSRPPTPHRAMPNSDEEYDDCTRLIKLQLYRESAIFRL
ncbi:hypothetical protein AWZ03_015131, partial [Drosophila navojoa]